MNKRVIESISARQVYTKRFHPGIEAIVRTRGGAVGRAVCTAGISMGAHEVKYRYDGGEKWKGMGLQGAIDIIEKRIAPALIGSDCADQKQVDHIMLGICENAKEELGGNAIAAVSAAALKAGAGSLDIPLYRHIGGANAFYLPVPGLAAVVGHERYGGGITDAGTKPTYSFMFHGYNSFAEASYAAWEMQQRWKSTMKGMGIYPPDIYDAYHVPAGYFETDEGIWDLMSDAIVKSGNSGRVGIQVDVASNCYYDPSDEMYHGLFSPSPKTAANLMELYKYMVHSYPFVILEDPFHEDDYQNHARLSREVDIQIVGDDLFTTNSERLMHGARLGAANAVLLKVNQIGTVTEALEMVQLAYGLGYGIMPCESRGEGEAIADYCVGINACSIREMAVGPVANRFLEIEEELGEYARFSGTQRLKGRRFGVRQST